MALTASASCKPKILFVFMTIITIAQIINSRLDTILITKFNESVSNIFYTKIIKFYENNYKDLELGKLTYRINSVPTVLREITTDLVTWILPKILTVVIINCYFFKINFMLGFISILFITGITYYNLNYSKPCINLSNQRYNTYEQKSEFIQDRLSNLYSVYSTWNTNTEIDNYKVLTKKFKDTVNDENDKEFDITAYSVNSYGYASINIVAGNIYVCYTQVIKAPLPEELSLPTPSYTSVQKITYKITKRLPYLTYKSNIKEISYTNDGLKYKTNGANGICKKIKDNPGGYITGKEGKLFCYKKKIKKINKV